MKKKIFVLLFLMIVLSLYAQSYRAYLQVTYFPIPRTVSIIVGDSVIIPKDSKGQPLQFKTSVAVLNWLSKKGWHVEPINMISQQNHTYIMSRENTTDKEISVMFR
jgi:hypothetical protein